MIVVASKNGLSGIHRAMAVLLAGGSALDAVEAGIRVVEEDPHDHSVGLGGFPNILGEVELDASIMDGKTLSAGAVGGIKGFIHPISIARKVMEKLPHVFLVGEGASRFARESGFESTNLLTEEAAQSWAITLKKVIPQHVFDHLADVSNLTQWVKQATSTPDSKHSINQSPAALEAKPWLKSSEQVGKSKDTVNFIAQDVHGDLAVGVSTSGWFAKYPGRLGDAPIIGAGNYADNRFGAAACTGMGEMAIRSVTAHSVVLYMKVGYPLQKAGLQAMQDLNDLGGNYLDEMNIICLDRQGNPAAFTNKEGNTFIYLTDVSNEVIELPREFIPTHQCWKIE